jgi:hypothetical protein
LWSEENVSLNQTSDEPSCELSCPHVPPLTDRTPVGAPPTPQGLKEVDVRERRSNRL